MQALILNWSYHAFFGHLQGVLGIQTNLINLYSNNLSAIATQAALIGGFSFTAVIMQADTASITSMTLSYFYLVPFTVCLVAALFVLSQATIVVMFGPTMALKVPFCMVLWYQGY